MTREEAILQLNFLFVQAPIVPNKRWGCKRNEALSMAIEALSADRPIADKCDDCLYEDSDKSLFPCTYCKRNHFDKYEKDESNNITESQNDVIESQDDVIEVVRCKDCRYYEQDVWREVDGVPIIVAHHICEFWNGACHVKPDGYCSYGELAEGGDAEVNETKSPYMQQSRHDDGRPQEELLTHEQAWAEIGRPQHDRERKI